MQTIRNLAHLLWLLNHVRVEQGLTVKRWAEKAGLKDASLGRYLRGEQKPNAGVLWQMAEAVGWEITAGPPGEPASCGCHHYRPPATE